MRPQTDKRVLISLPAKTKVCLLSLQNPHFILCPQPFFLIKLYSIIDIPVFPFGTSTLYTTVFSGLNMYKIPIVLAWIKSLICVVHKELIYYISTVLSAVNKIGTSESLCITKVLLEKSSYVKLQSHAIFKTVLQFVFILWKHFVVQRKQEMQELKCSK